MGKKKNKYNILTHIIVLVLVQVLVLSHSAWAFQDFSRCSTDTLSPQIQIQSNHLKFVLRSVSQKQNQPVSLRPFALGENKLLVYDRKSKTAIRGHVWRKSVSLDSSMKFGFYQPIIRHITGCALVTLRTKQGVALLHLFPDQNKRRIKSILKSFSDKVRNKLGNHNGVYADVLLSDLTYQYGYKIFADSVIAGLQDEFNVVHLDLKVETGEIRDLSFDVQAEKWDYEVKKTSYVQSRLMSAESSFKRVFRSLVKVFSFGFAAYMFVKYGMMDNVGELGSGAGVAMIIGPTGPKHLIEKIKAIVRTGTVKEEKQRQWPESSQRQSNENKQSTADQISFTREGKIAVAYQRLIKKAQSAMDSKGRTYFSVKQGFLRGNKHFVIRPITTREEIKTFQKSLKRRNFDWLQTFQSTDGLEEYLPAESKVLFYGVFDLGSKGQEEKIVAASYSQIKSDGSGNFF